MMTVDEHVDSMAIARRKTCRRVASCLVHAMAESDMGFPEIAARIGKPEGTVKRWLGRLISGHSFRGDLDAISHMAMAMRMEIGFQVVDSTQEEPQP